MPFATVSFVATTAETFTESQIAAASAIMAALPPGSVTTAGNQNAFGNHLANAMKQLQKGKVSKAIDDLNKATEKTDDCALRGSPDGNGKGMDWISDCDAQDAIYALLTSVVARCSRKPRLPKRHRTPEGCRKRFRQPQALGGKRSVEIPAVRRVRAGPALPVATRAALRDPDSLHDARVILMRAGDSRR